MEIWKDIPDTEKLYCISNYGRVKAKKRIVNRRKKGALIIKEHIVKGSIDSEGYKRHTCSIRGKKVFFKCHQMVALLFIGKRKENKVVNHKDYNKLNNRVDNLEYVSIRENVCHGKNKGKNSSMYVGVRKQHNRLKYSSEIHYNGKYIFLGSYDTEEEAAEA